MAKEIQLTGGKVAIVDDEDYEWLNQWEWRYSAGYAVRNSLYIHGKRTLIYMHRLVMQTPDGMQTDHIDGNKLNNQRNNLRICTRSDNLRNRGKQINNTSGYKGVRWSKAAQKWQAQIESDKRFVYLGLFDNIQDAARAYNVAALEYHGEFAWLNEIDK